VSEVEEGKDGRKKCLVLGIWLSVSLSLVPGRAESSCAESRDRVATGVAGVTGDCDGDWVALEGWLRVGRFSGDAWQRQGSKTG